MLFCGTFYSNVSGFYLIGQLSLESFYICLFVIQIQLIRIELRVPEYGWTTQKVFHLMNFIVNGGDALVISDVLILILTFSFEC